MSIVRALALLALVTLGPPSAHAGEVRAVVYFHVIYHHYFMTSDANEIAVLDAPEAPPWKRAGPRFFVESEPGPGLAPVCRFYTTAHGGKASHFFTASAAECDRAKTLPDWNYEGIVFHVRLPDAGSACGEGTVPMYRLYNDGRGGAPNHAYTAEALQRDRLKANGFVEEGVAFCVRVEGEPAAKMQPLLGTSWNMNYLEFMGGLGSMVATFATTVGSTSAIDAKFHAVGLPVTGSNTTYMATDRGWSGAATWDRVSASYVMFRQGKFDHPENAYTFDASDPATLTGCLHYLVDGPSTAPLPAFQPLVWIPCRSTTAKKRP